jgi:hypothetical protein
MIYDVSQIVLIVFSAVLGWMLSKTYVTPKITEMNTQQKFIFLFIMFSALFFSLKLFLSVI